MDQTDRNALDYESCRRVWRRVSPELDPYPEEREEARGSWGTGGPIWRPPGGRPIPPPGG